MATVITITIPARTSSPSSTESRSTISTASLGPLPRVALPSESTYYTIDCGGAAAATTTCSVRQVLNDYKWYQGNLPTGIFFPGYSCPPGWESKCDIVGPEATSLSSLRTDLQVWRSLGINQTATGCCPNGFACDLSEVLTCRWTAPPGFSVLGYNATNTSSQGYVYADSTRIVVITGRKLMYLPGAGPPPTDAPEPFPSKTGEPDDGGSGLTQSQIAAIATVIPLATIALILGCCFTCRARKRAKSGGDNAAEAEGEESTVMPSEAELGADPKKESDVSVSELPNASTQAASFHMSELVAMSQVPELFGGDGLPPNELPGDNEFPATLFPQRTTSTTN